MEVENHVRQFKDFLYLYNHISETCFNFCISGFNTRDLSKAETACIDRCVGKHVSVNHRIMAVYAEVQPIYMQKRLDEMNKQMEAAQQQASTQIEEPQNLSADPQALPADSQA